MKFLKKLVGASHISGMPTRDSKSPLFKPRATYKPFDYPWAVQASVDHQKIHWTEEEAKVGQDVNDWNSNKLTSAEKFQIHETLKLFTQQDLTVASFYDTIIRPWFLNNDIAMMIRAFNTREDTHQRAYALLNDTLGLPESDYSAFAKEKEMADKIDFAMQADPTTIPGLAKALVKAVINEGLSLFGSFIPLLNYQRRGLMKGMGTVVEWSIRDETQHVIGITRLFHIIALTHPEILTDAFKKDVYDMFRMAIKLEDAFIDRIYSMGPVEGLKKEDLKLFMRSLADRRLLGLGFKENWFITEEQLAPMEWVMWILNAADHSNFFEKKVTEYEVAGLTGEALFDEVFVGELTVYTRDGCSYCKKVKTLLDLFAIPYRIVEMNDKAERISWFESQGLFGKAKTMPQVFNSNGDRIGGFSEVKTIVEARYGKVSI